MQKNLKAKTIKKIILGSVAIAAGATVIAPIVYFANSFKTITIKAKYQDTEKDLYTLRVRKGTALASIANDITTSSVVKSYQAKLASDLNKNIISLGDKIYLKNSNQNITSSAKINKNETVILPFTDLDEKVNLSFHLSFDAEFDDYYDSLDASQREVIRNQIAIGFYNSIKHSPWINLKDVKDKDLDKIKSWKDLPFECNDPAPTENTNKKNHYVFEIKSRYPILSKNAYFNNKDEKDNLKNIISRLSFNGSVNLPFKYDGDLVGDNLLIKDKNLQKGNYSKIKTADKTYNVEYVFNSSSWWDLVDKNNRDSKKVNINLEANKNLDVSVLGLASRSSNQIKTINEFKHDMVKEGNSFETPNFLEWEAIAKDKDADNKKSFIWQDTATALAYDFNQHKLVFSTDNHIENFGINRRFKILPRFFAINFYHSPDKQIYKIMLDNDLIFSAVTDNENDIREILRTNFEKIFKPLSRNINLFNDKIINIVKSEEINGQPTTTFESLLIKDYWPTDEISSTNHVEYYNYREHIIDRLLVELKKGTVKLATANYYDNKKIDVNFNSPFKISVDNKLSINENIHHKDLFINHIVNLNWNNSSMGKFFKMLGTVFNKIYFKELKDSSNNPYQYEPAIIKKIFVACASLYLENLDENIKNSLYETANILAGKESNAGDSEFKNLCKSFKDNLSSYINSKFFKINNKEQKVRNNYFIPGFETDLLKEANYSKITYDSLDNAIKEDNFKATSIKINSYNANSKKIEQITPITIDKINIQIPYYAIYNIKASFKGSNSSNNLIFKVLANFETDVNNNPTKILNLINYNYGFSLDKYKNATKESSSKLYYYGNEENKEANIWNTKITLEQYRNAIIHKNPRLQYASPQILRSIIKECKVNEAVNIMQLFALTDYCFQNFNYENDSTYNSLNNITINSSYDFGDKYIEKLNNLFNQQIYEENNIINLDIIKKGI
ncbi:hypothetical protein [Mycoplasmopsis primatum]|uniref:hypothetical protein n=1 Tax=Mycoplasmopsis primatum TaxID=55604 RepID=UPI00049545A0|nr:hypothetical protein [Mycoplasmopsis primatum]